MKQFFVLIIVLALIALCIGTLNAVVLIGSLFLMPILMVWAGFFDD